jgi:dolichol-phosphate mannosyltransferase
VKTVIIIPTYNEAANLAALLDRLLAQPVEAHELHALVVDDASPDGTAEVAEAAAGRWPGRVELLRRPAKTSLTDAYRAGFARALRGVADVIGQMDADGSHDPAVVPAMLDQLASADLVIGSRYCRGESRDSRDGYYRRIVSRIANQVIMRGILRVPITDPTSGFRLWRRTALQRIDPVRRMRARAYGIQAELAVLAEASGCRIAEVPIHFGTRRAGRSKMTPAVQLRTVAEIVSLPWVQREAIASLRAQTRASERTAGAAVDAPRRETALP